MNGQIIHKIGYFLIAVLGMSRAAFGEIVLDGTLGSKGALSGPVYDIKASLGRKEGNNLFHSFQSFNLDKGEAALFSSPARIENVISRVTGGKRSYLNGALMCSIPGADLYFLNPAGIMFGEEARINIQGSLHVSTADYLRLGEDGRFDAGNPEASVFTSAPPSAFGFLNDAPADISKKLGFLQVPNGETVSFVGGDLALQDGRVTLNDEQVFNSFLRSTDGRVNLVSIASPGEVPVNPEEMPEGAFERFGTITVADSTPYVDYMLRNSANIHVSGSRGGKVYIQGGNILFDNSHVYADTEGNGKGRGVIVKAADELVFVKGARITAVSSDSGDAGNIMVAAKRISIKEGAQLVTSTREQGAAGDIKVDATESLKISGRFSELVSDEVLHSSIESNTKVGTGGNITISASNIMLSEGGAVLATTNGIGSAGAISLFASDMMLSEGGAVLAWTKGIGPAGAISLELNRLTLESGGKISLSAGSQETIGKKLADSTGNGGNLTIVAKESVLISGQADGLRSALLNNVFNAGEGGEISVSAPQIEIREGGSIEAGTRGDGSAGRISLNADSVHIHQGGLLTTDTAGGRGAAGDIVITARDSVVIAERDPQARANVSSAALNIDGGQGDAGDINITTPHLTVHNDGQISSATESAGQGGGIAILNADTLILESNGKINASTSGSGKGGNIHLNAHRIRITGNGKIKAGTSGSGKGGNIHLNAHRIRITDNGNISASSESCPLCVQGPGNAGEVRLEVTDTVHIDNGAINTSAKDADGGDIHIGTPTRLILINNATVSTQITGKEGSGGNISANAVKLIYLRDSALTADVKDGMGNGGNIAIHPSPNFVILGGNSCIIANAYGGDGGNITIIAGQYIESPGSLVQASSQLGIDGKIRINASKNDVSEGLVLPTDLNKGSTLLKNRCAVRDDESSMVETGRGGVSEDELEDMRADSLASAGQGL
ncbi:MAG: filamentous hemagglutinin N-terminal domain-containing protein [Gammaproteobacteria bacterium]|nr:filamentous hemagglutinin N-terminal domain-containing protein [Gammaproteobacteria bacterium]